MNIKLLEANGLTPRDLDPNPVQPQVDAAQSIIDYNVMMGVLEDPSIEVNDNA